MNPTLRKIAVAATTLSVAVILPVSLATPAGAATTVKDPVQTVKDLYCGYDANPFCQ